VEQHGTNLLKQFSPMKLSSGWQQVLFANPVCSSYQYHVYCFLPYPTGQYVATNPYFTAAVVNGPLRALANGEDGGNGLYIYTSAPAFRQVLIKPVIIGWILCMLLLWDLM